MARLITCALLLTAVFVCTAGAQALPDKRPVTADTLIARDRADGKITEKEVLRHTAERLFRPEELPDRYRSAPTGPGRNYCLTPEIVNLHKNWDKLDADTRALVPEKFHRGQPVRDMDIRKGSFSANALAPAGPLFKGDGGDFPGSPNVGQHTYATTNFLIHWDSTAGDPDRLKQTADSDSDGVPDMIEEAGAALETTWTWFVDRGYKLPPGMTNNYYNIYFETNSGIWGYCMPLDAAQASRSYIVLVTDFSGGQRIDGSTIGAIDQMRTTASHELFHAVQFGYDSYEDPWWMEGCAVWISDIIGPAVGRRGRVCLVGGRLPVPAGNGARLP